MRVISRASFDLTTTTHQFAQAVNTDEEWDFLLQILKGTALVMIIE